MHKDKWKCKNEKRSESANDSQTWEFGAFFCSSLFKHLYAPPYTPAPIFPLRHSPMIVAGHPCVLCYLYQVIMSDFHYTQSASLPWMPIYRRAIFTLDVITDRCEQLHLLRALITFLSFACVILIFLIFLRYDIRKCQRRYTMKYPYYSLHEKYCHCQ